MRQCSIWDEGIRSVRPEGMTVKLVPFPVGLAQKNVS